MANTNALFDPNASVYQRTNHTLATRYETICECGNCQWQDQVDLNEVDFFSLQKLVDNMHCPVCNQTALTLKLSSKVRPAD